MRAQVGPEQALATVGRVVGPETAVKALVQATADSLRQSKVLGESEKTAIARTNLLGLLPHLNERLKK